MFNGSGNESISVEHIIDEVVVKNFNDPMHTSFCIEQSSEPLVSVRQEESQARDLDSMHWRHLKALVEVYGETWENKEKAIAFLKGKA